MKKNSGSPACVVARLSAALAASCFLCAPCSATIIIENGSTAIGTLSATVFPTGLETGNFTLYPEYRTLMSDAAGQQFRFFQVIYYDDEPSAFLAGTNPLTGAAPHTATVVDPPAGGWQYQQPLGDDNSPFYESDTLKNPVTGQYYASPGKTYPNTHSADTAVTGMSSTSDWPTLLGPSHQTLFETYLVYLDPFLAANRRFDLLGGYSWGVGTDASNATYAITPTDLPFSTIDSTKVTELQGALDRSGFSGPNAWTVQAVGTFYPSDIPEPSTTVLLATGLIAFVVCKLAHKRARRSGRD